jgi:hypothetical protein
MREVKDFSNYSESELRKLLIENAKPIASGMQRVVREITKKYKACDREMLLWFIKQPPYNGSLWAPDSKPAITVEEAARHERRYAMTWDAAVKKKIDAAKTHKPKHTATTVVYPMLPKRQAKPKEIGIIQQFRTLGCKPVLIAEKVVGITRMGAYAEIDRIKAAFPDWKVVEV